MSDLKDHIINKYLKFKDPSKPENSAYFDALFDQWHENIAKNKDYSIHEELKRQYVPLEKQLDQLIRLETLPPQTQVSFARDLNTGEILTDQLIEVTRNVDGLSSSSVSGGMAARAVGNLSSANKTYHGKTITGTPFQPGGMKTSQLQAEFEKELNFMKHISKGPETDDDLLIFPPGFDSGFDFSKNAVVSKPGDFKVEVPEDQGEQESEPEASKNSETEKSADNEPEFKDPENEITDLVRSSEIRQEIKLTSIKQSKQQTSNSKYVIMLDSTQGVEDFETKIVPNMPMKYPFKLDPFQQHAVKCLENRDSILVAAHTSAGKTVVAEYAIALAGRHMTKVIYTSPIKALSNQKYRDFKNAFGDVGLLTGDIQISPDAFCLIMTTEVLRSMLYHGSDTIRDVEFVIFDECHYLNDPERGVVWEEVLIMLPDHIGIILLSATLPNIEEFADWVGRTKERPIYVVQTLYRPVPLEYSLFTGNSMKTIKELYKIVDAKGNFIEDNYKKAKKAKLDRQSKFKQSYGAKGNTSHSSKQTDQTERQIWQTAIELLKGKDCLPAVAFTLSRKRCDNNVNLLRSLDLTDAKEKSYIHNFFNRVLSRLNEFDRKLPQIQRTIEMTKRGLGVHHSGVLPILKEAVEMLFATGVIKILFATETFAMGVNMPARSVLFDSIRKHDGKQVRNLKTSEFIQMAGRAGRRGLDTVGTVIILCKNVDLPSVEELKFMLLGKASKLESKFRLTYQMLLNQIRSACLSPYDIIKRSFSEVVNRKEEPDRIEKMLILEKQVAERKLEHNFHPGVIAYVEALKNGENLNEKLLNFQQISVGQTVILKSGHLGVILEKNEGKFSVFTFNVEQAR